MADQVRAISQDPPDDPQEFAYRYASKLGDRHGGDAHARCAILRSGTPKSDRLGKVFPSGTLFGRPCSLGVVVRSSPSFLSARTWISAQRFWATIPSLARRTYICSAAA